jgi:hypothetical protein
LVWAFHLAVAAGFERVTIEGDSQLCIDFLTGKCVVGSWRVSNILSELIFSFSSFPSWSFLWIPRSANCAAHILARWSLLNRYWGTFIFYLSPQCFVHAVTQGQLQSSDVAVSF